MWKTTVIKAIACVCMQGHAAESIASASFSDVLVMLDQQPGAKKPKKIKLTLDDKSKSVTYKSHNAEKITVRFRQEDLDMNWSDIEAEESLSVVDKFSLDAEGYLLLARFALAEGLEKKVKKYCASATRKDSNKREDSKAILAALKSGSGKTAGGGKEEKFTGVVGWRGDGTGRYPDAKPPLQWSKKSTAMLGMKSTIGDSKTAVDMSDGVIKEWLVLGPFAKGTSLDNEGAVIGKEGAQHESR